MPTMDFFADQGTDKHMALIEVLAYMYFPDNEEDRERYVSFRYGDLVLSGAKDGQVIVPEEMFAAILKAKNPEKYREPPMSIVSQGSIAGVVLLGLLEMQAGGEEPSVNKSVYLAKDYFSRAINAYGGKSTVNSLQKIKSAWSKYKSVSHLWAANTLASTNLGQQVAIDRATQEPLTFLAEAEAVRRAASKLPHNLGTVMWKMPEAVQVPLCDFQFTRMSPKNAELLSQYDARMWNW